MNTKILGAAGENSAVKFLLKNKYIILQKNYKTKFGEIDIIAKDKEYIVFVEVKTRTSTKYGLPCQAVNLKKQNIIGKVGANYISVNNLNNACCRFDVIEVISNEKGIHRINHIKNAFQPEIY